MVTNFNEILDLITYVKEGPAEPDAVRASIIFQIRPRYIAASLFLDWLLERGEGRTSDPLELKRGSSWLQALRELLEEKEALGKLFVVSDNYLNFCKSVSTSDKEEVEKFVVAHYEPPTFES
jgi:hypothetical protein